MAKPKAASVPTGTVMLTLCLSPGVHDNLKQLAVRRKEAKRSGKPASIAGIVEDAFSQLSTQIQSRRVVAFVSTPRTHEGRTAIRVSATAHAIATESSEIADVKLSDFVRTAIIEYLRRHSSEIDQEAKTASHRGRKQARR